MRRLDAGWHSQRQAPTEPREAALQRQADIIRDTIRDAERLATARQEIIQRREAEIDGRELSPGQRGAITRRHAKAVAEERGYGKRLPLPGRTLITGNQGTGKTTRAIEAVAAIRAPLVVWVTEPTTAKAAEVAADYRSVATADSLPAFVVLGRAQPDPKRPGHNMCDRHEAAELVAQAGLSVPEQMCTTCPLRDECGSRRQAGELQTIDGGAVFFLAAAYLWVPAPAPAPDLLIIDERLTIEAVEVAKIPYAALDPYGVPRVPQFVRERLDVLRAALLMPNALDFIRAAGFTREVLRGMTEALASAADVFTPEIDGRMSDEDIQAALENATTRKALRSALAVVSAVKREIDIPAGVVVFHDGNPSTEQRRVTNAVYARAEAGAEATITVSRLRRPHGIKHATTLLLDGTGDEILNRAVFGERLRHERIAVERQGSITGSIGRGYSRTSITGTDRQGEAIKNRATGAARTRADIETIRAQLPGSAALFCAKDVEAALIDSGAMSRDAPGGTFGALRGLNCWEHTRAAVVVGALSLTIGDLEDTARAYMASDPQPFVSMDQPAPAGWRDGQWPYVATRIRRMKDGSQSPVIVEVHPDPRCQRVLEQVREAEVVQAGDRSRPVFNPRELVFLNNLAVDVSYDEIRTHKELVAGGNRLELTFKQFGMLPKGGRDLHRLDPGRYRTPKAAEHAAAELPGTLKRSLFFGSGEFAYRVDGQPGLPSSAVIDLTRHRDPLAVLRRHFGNITEFQGVKIALAPAVAGLRPDQQHGRLGGGKSLPVAVPYSRPWTQGPPRG